MVAILPEPKDQRLGTCFSISNGTASYLPVVSVSAVIHWMKNRNGPFTSSALVTLTHMLNATVRADGSSKFRGHRYGYFPSISAGWIMTNEKFMERTCSWLDHLSYVAGAR